MDQSKPLSGGETCDPGYLLGWFRHGMLSDAPSPDHPALSGLTSVWQIAPVLAFIDLPATDTLQTCAAGFRKVLHRLAQGDAALDSLPKWERWPHRLRHPLAWTFPRGRGPVTQADITRFAAGFPLFARWLNVVLGPRLAKPEGAAAASANAVATSALGIPVDMRIGSLVSPSAVSDAICLAAGSDGYSPGGRRAERLARFVEH
ncbi:hypothetical protein [Siccirubricoccus deserti]|uniref:Uncharacterized protein n=1 Tax=Siccirubricoccus deserti TaxID=2013562 RepID=A0A9X0R2I8_9PROT|nr:hypothetical protein [Siccirubricoccus deserti]MBC4018406.1 hypothetical protein [Siccirubricoccus deserti]